MEYIIKDKPEKIIYKMTRNGPDEFKAEDIHLSALTKSLFDFLYEHFRGSIQMHFSGEPFGSIHICPSGLAYFIKLILIEVYGNSLVKASFDSTQRRFTIEIQHELGERDLSYIMKVARMSGFDEEVYESGRIVISTRVFPDRRPSFYSHTDNYLTNLIAYVFML